MLKSAHNRPVRFDRSAKNSLSHQSKMNVIAWLSDHASSEDMDDGHKIPLILTVVSMSVVCGGFWAVVIAAVGAMTHMGH